MATQVNIFRHEWCELVFDQRNHNYGAFVIRQTSDKRHFLAMMITLSTLILGILIFNIKGIEEKILIPEDKRPVELSAPPVNDPDYVRPPDMEPINRDQLISSMSSVQPIITDTESETIDTSIHTQQELIDFQGRLSNVDFVGNSQGTVIPTKEIIGAPVDNEIHDFVSQPPQFPGGNGELFKYFKSNMNYPQIALDNGVQGTVFVQFVVYASGEIGNINVARGFDESCEKEALRVIKKMGKWIPGKQNGNAVNVRLSVPVKFKINN